MSIVSFEPVDEESSYQQYLLRGKNCYSWKQSIFKEVEPYDPNNGGVGFHFLILFDPQLFLAITPAGIDDILQILSQTDPEKDNIFSVAGKPFFAISRGAFKKLPLELTEDKNVIQKLRANGNVRLLNLQYSFETLDVRRDLRVIEDVVIQFQIDALLKAGVIIDDLNHFFMEGLLEIGSGTRIGSGVVITGDSRIGAGVTLYPHCFIENSIIGDDCILLPGCIIRDSQLEQKVQIGPYTHLRVGALVKEGAKMGNFVEMKKSVLGIGSKSMHLTYIGDADVGEKVNIGAGTITCNYDGINKNKTIIEDGVFIGSGTELVAPVTIRKNAYVGAGSTITEEVPADSLGVARNKQRNILDWVTRKKRKKA
jgi:bifunctional N-acetylglucosamine-1-phosphate-uridyltransferase/glucosamine-1-phosphate-acetyltransferase GlmU-like protein